MKTLTALLAIVALMLTSSAFATLYQANDYSSSWVSNSAWTVGTDFPGTPADEAYFPGPASNRTMTIPCAVAAADLWQGACTAAVVTIYNSTGLAWSLIGNSGSGRNNLLVLTNDSGNARVMFGGPANMALESSLKIQINQPTDMICSGGYLRLKADFNGSQPMNFIGNGGHPQAYTGSASTNYTGDINIYGGYTEYYTGTFVNATYVLRSGSVLANQYNQRILNTKIRALETAQLSIAAPAGSVNSFYNDVSIENGSVLTTTYGNAGVTSKFLANIYGIGSMFFALNGLNTNFFTGAITPGLGGVGKLTIDQTVSLTKGLSNFFGMAGDALDLGIEVTGSGGVPGTDYDQLELLNMNGEVDLANINVNFAALSNNAEVSWFLKSNTQLLNDFADVTGTNGLPITFFGKSGDGLSYGVLVGIPEPALAVAALLALLPLRKRF